MAIYAGIDEAGYGPLFGPLVIGAAAMRVPDDAIPSIEAVTAALNDEPSPTAIDAPPTLWDRLDDAVSRTLSKRRGRIAVNDSKKVHTPAAGPKHLEFGVLCFAHLAKQSPDNLGGWLDRLGVKQHRQLNNLPWYQATSDRPWCDLPSHWTAGEIGIARRMLQRSMQREAIDMLGFGGEVVFEDRFNHMVAATHSKAALSFTFVARHLLRLWDRFGVEAPADEKRGLHVIVDRQSGRSHYRNLLAENFPGATIQVVSEDGKVSAYRVRQSAGQSRDRQARAMSVRFEVNGDGNHMPVALASMASKYTRELLMARFQQWFGEQLPSIKPTKGYGADGKRFWQQVKPQLASLAIEPKHLRRMA